MKKYLILLSLLFAPSILMSMDREVGHGKSPNAQQQQELHMQELRERVLDADAQRQRIERIYAHRNAAIRQIKLDWQEMEARHAECSSYVYAGVAVTLFSAGIALGLL